MVRWMPLFLGLALIFGACRSEAHKAPAPAGAVGAVNTQCPCGAPVNPDVTAPYHGATVGFCGPGCKHRWEGMSEAQKDRMLRKALAGSATPVNSRCPVSGEEVDPAVTTAYHGMTVGFCCPKCRRKWATLSEAERDAMLGKVR